MRLVALIGKGGSVFNAAMTVLGKEVDLHSVVIYNHLFKPGSKAIRDKTHFIKMNDVFYRRLHRLIKPVRKDAIVFSWFNKIMPPWFFRLDYRAYNQHPSLLPAFQGLNAWQQALNYGVKITGSTIHEMTENVDCGKIILQDALRIDSRHPVENRHLLFNLQVNQFVEFIRTRAWE